MSDWITDIWGIISKTVGSVLKGVNPMVGLSEGIRTETGLQSWVDDKTEVNNPLNQITSVIVIGGIAYLLYKVIK